MLAYEAAEWLFHAYPCFFHHRLINNKHFSYLLEEKYGCLLFVIFMYKLYYAFMCEFFFCSSSLCLCNAKLLIVIMAILINILHHLITNLILSFLTGTFVADQAGVTCKMHSCLFCGKIFDRHDHMIRHVRIHTGEKPWSCDICLRRFNTSTSLKRHQITHLNTTVT